MKELNAADKAFSTCYLRALADQITAAGAQLSATLYVNPDPDPLTLERIIERIDCTVSVIEEELEYRKPRAQPMTCEIQFDCKVERPDGKLDFGPFIPIPHEGR